MSSELERLLRDAREALPGPDDDATLHARRRAVTPPRRRRARIVVLVGATLVAAMVIGVTAGSLTAPTGTAAREPAVLGFVPEPGWFALQSPPPAVPGQQTVAVAANVPFAADDVVHGLVEPSGLPYSTLLRLPPRGIVIVSTMVPDAEPHVAPIPTSTTYREAKLPLRLRDGVTYLQWGAQVRPDQPLAQYQLRARIQRHNVDVVAYFGTSRPSRSQLDAAQRQLDGLVIRPGDARGTRQAAAARPSAAAVTGDRPHIHVQHDDPGRSLRAEDSCALRRQKGFGVGEAAVRRRGDRRMGRAVDGPAERAAQLPRVDHGRVPHGVDHRRQRVRGIPGARGRGRSGSTSRSAAPRARVSA